MSDEEIQKEMAELTDKIGGILASALGDAPSEEGMQRVGIQIAALLFLSALACRSVGIAKEKFANMAALAYDRDLEPKDVN